MSIRWSPPFRTYDLDVRCDRMSVYAQVLQEGNNDDVRWFVDIDELINIWDDLVLPRHVCVVWLCWMWRHWGLRLPCIHGVRTDRLAGNVADTRPIERVTDQHDDLNELDPDEGLARLNRWVALGGDETGPPEDWREAVELIEVAYQRLAASRERRETLIALSDGYSAVIERHLDEE